MDQIGKQSMEIACKESSSQACNTTMTSLSMASIAFGILLIGLFIAGVLGFVRWIFSIISNI